jgi:hypothetical protein
MTGDQDILERLVDYHDHIAVPGSVVADDVRRGRRRVRRNRGLAAGGTAVAVAAVVLAASLLANRDSTRQEPIGPGPTQTSAPRPSAEATWPGPLRENGTRAVVFGHRDPATANGILAPDAADVGLGAIDIRSIRIGEVGSNDRWVIDLQRQPPDASTLAAAHRIVEYGVIIDGDGDRVADCEIGINNDAPKAGDYRVWVKNLRSGVTHQQVGGPYGYPIDFGYYKRQFTFFFLAEAPTRCGPISASANFYAWSSLSEQGQVTAWDYAPDNAWLAMRQEPR